MNPSADAAAPASRPPGIVDEALQPFEVALRQRFASAPVLIAEARADVERRRQQAARARRRTTGGAAAAGMVALAVWLADPAWSTRDIRTAVGQRMDVTLDEGHRLTLDSATMLQVQSHVRSTRLALTQGEVLVDVAPGARPLGVQAAGVRVVDLGTIFDVKLAAATLPATASTVSLAPVTGFWVTVLTGAVDVTADTGAASRGGAMRVHAGQSLHLFRPTGPGAGWPRGAAVSVDVDGVMAWRHGTLSFDGTPLADAVADLQRHHLAPITLGDAHVAGLRLSGQYDTDAVDALLDALPLVMPVTVRRSADGAVSIASR